MAEGEILLGYPMGLDDIVRTYSAAPDDAWVILSWLAWGNRGDGTWGPPRVPLGRIREEQLIRLAFPHFVNIGGEVL